MDRDARRRLRGAVYHGDGARIIAELTEADVTSCPQIVGDALLIALAQRVPGAEAPASRCVRALVERDWMGDALLADQLGAVLRSPGGEPALPEVTVDLEDLADVLRGNPADGGGRLDLATGDVWPELAFAEREYTDEDEDELDDDRWLFVDATGSRDAYDDMRHFVDDWPDRRAASLLAVAIDGPGALGRFRRTLEQLPEVDDSWYRFSEERWRGRARQWLADAGYRPAVSPAVRATDAAAGVT